MSTPAPPTLHDVLSRKRRAPIDLYMFYLFLKDRNAANMLDFWLDAQAHENLCRSYLSGIQRSGRSLKREWPQYYDYVAQRGSIYGSVRPPSDRTLDQFSSRAVSPVFMSRRASHDIQQSPSPRTSTTHNRSVSNPLSLYSSTISLCRLTGTFSRRSIARAPTVVPRNGSANITRTDLIASAERIFQLYFEPGAACNIALPQHLRIRSFSLSAHELPRPTSPEYDVDAAALAQVPDMFHAQKEHVFKVMGRLFPMFLLQKSSRNLTYRGAILRLFISSLFLWVGFSVAFALIFLDFRPYSTRLYTFIPFTLGAYFYFSCTYHVDPILVFFARYETTCFKYHTLEDDYPGYKLVRRALWICALAITSSAALTVLFGLVPGHRL